MLPQRKSKTPKKKQTKQNNKQTNKNTKNTNHNGYHMQLVAGEARGKFTD